MDSNDDKNVQVTIATDAERPLFRNLMQAYEHDLSEFTGDVPGPDGIFSVGEYFDVFWTEPERFPFKILHRHQIAGFALVRSFEPGAYSMSEFFVLRSFRRTGVGRAAAILLFRQFAGEWHVAQDDANEPAQRFWRQTIGDYTNGDFIEAYSESRPRGAMRSSIPKGKEPAPIMLPFPLERRRDHLAAREQTLPTSHQ
ncbi:MAG: GNAT family N-acetyltransferase [Pseudomonadota bacterium]